MTAHEAIVGDAAKLRYRALGVDIEEVKAQLLKVNNLALEGKTRRYDHYFTYLQR